MNTIKQLERLRDEVEAIEDEGTKETYLEMFADFCKIIPEEHEKAVGKVFTRGFTKLIDAEIGLLSAEKGLQELAKLIEDDWKEVFGKEIRKLGGVADLINP